MNRFFGMMPSSETEIIKNYANKEGNIYTIEAGKNGWTIIYPDSSSRFEDTVSSADDNFKKAYSILFEEHKNLVELEKSKR